MWRCLLQSFVEMHEVVQTKETGQVPRVTPATGGFGQALEVTFVAGEVGSDPTTVMEVELMVCHKTIFRRS
jgi:hypothetical protein